MSKATEQEAFEAWKAEFAASLTSDPEKKAAFEKVADLDVFKATLRTQDYHKKLNELDLEKKKHQSEYKQMGEWFNTAKAKAVEIESENTKLKADLAKVRKAKSLDLDDVLDDGNPGATDDPPASSVSKEMLDQLMGRLTALDQGAPAYTNVMVKLALKAQKEGVELDPDKLFETAQTNRVDLERAYDILAQPARDERREAEIKARIEKAREEARAEALSQLPPDRVRAAQGPPPAIAKLFANNTPPTPGAASGDPARVASAVEEWTRLTQAGQT